MTTVKLKSIIIVRHLFHFNGRATEIIGHFCEKYCCSCVGGRFWVNGQKNVEETLRYGVLPNFISLGHRKKVVDVASCW